MGSRNFTTTLSDQTIDWLDRMSKSTGLSKNQIIEEALATWKKEELQEKLRASYETARKKDTEWVAVARGGVVDWEAHITIWEE